VRLFGGRLAAREESGAAPGTVLTVAKDALRIAARGGVIEVAKLRVGSAGKVAAGDAGIAAGERLA
jgi:methionyl-tRNA formyltransferase